MKTFKELREGIFGNLVKSMVMVKKLEKELNNFESLARKRGVDPHKKSPEMDKLLDEFATKIEGMIKKANFDPKWDKMMKDTLKKALIKYKS